MRSHKRKSTGDFDFQSGLRTDFESAIEESPPELPPGDIVRNVTPWRRAMNRILAGLALNAVTLNFWNLNYVLPLIGMILSLLGFRALRRENGWLKGCFIFSAVRMVYFLTILILNTAVFQSEVYASTMFHLLGILNQTFAFILLFCFWRGLRAIQQNAGLPPQGKEAAVLIVWYALVCFLAGIKYDGMFIGIVLIAAYILLIRSLLRVSEELDEAGYAVCTAPVRISDRAVTAAILFILASGIVCGYLFWNSYPMTWSSQSAEWNGIKSAEWDEARNAERNEIDASEKSSSRTSKWGENEPKEPGDSSKNPKDSESDIRIQEIQKHLTGLGFPKDVLNDLTEEEITSCEGALRVVTDTADYAVNDGRRVTVRDGSRTTVTTVYDVEELRLTNVAVELAGEQGQEMWKIFHHFLWTEDPGFYGTEAIQLYPAYRLNEGWSGVSDVTGRVLYDDKGKIYSSPYYSLGTKTYISDSIFWGEQTSSDIFAEFSMPRTGENHRGYISYMTEEVQDGYILDSWVSYTHQRTWLQYPVRTAAQHRMTSSASGAGAFFSVDDTFQFDPNHIEESDG